VGLRYDEDVVEEEEGRPGDGDHALLEGARTPPVPQRDDGDGVGDPGEGDEGEDVLLQAGQIADGPLPWKL
jgi:hypothetical protein